jgi:hypothetical protein
MNKTYKGPLAWFKRWNFRRVERRRWLRDLFDAIPATDAAKLEALTYLVEKANAEAEARTAWQASSNQRLEQLSKQVGALADQVAALTGKLSGGGEPR